MMCYIISIESGEKFLSKDIDSQHVDLPITWQWIPDDALFVRRGCKISCSTQYDMMKTKQTTYSDVRLSVEWTQNCPL